MNIKEKLKNIPVNRKNIYTICVIIFFIVIGAVSIIIANKTNTKQEDDSPLEATLPTDELILFDNHDVTLTIDNSIELYCNLDVESFTMESNTALILDEKIITAQSVGTYTITFSVDYENQTLQTDVKFIILDPEKIFITQDSTYDFSKHVNCKHTIENEQVCELVNNYLSFKTDGSTTLVFSNYYTNITYKVYAVQITILVDGEPSSLENLNSTFEITIDNNNYEVQYTDCKNIIFNTVFGGKSIAKQDSMSSKEFSFVLLIANEFKIPYSGTFL